jgi:predicted enzyme related to lactoylglutathione lyase
MTPNPGVAREFYGEVFDWTFEIGGPNTGGYTMCRLDNSTVAGLGQLPANSRFPTAWQVYFATANLDQSVERALACGGAVLIPPTRILTLGSLAVVKDCAGATVGLWQAEQHIGAQVMHEPNSITWFEVNTRDRPRTEHFYTQVFGLASHQYGELDYSTLHSQLQEPQHPAPQLHTPQPNERRAQEHALCGVLQMNEAWGDMASHWLVYFAVHQLNTTTQRITNAGGRLCYPPFETPRGRLAIVEDPMGATFAIIEQRTP